MKFNESEQKYHLTWWNFINFAEYCCADYRYSECLGAVIGEWSCHNGGQRGSRDTRALEKGTYVEQVVTSGIDKIFLNAVKFLWASKCYKTYLSVS